VRAFVRDPDDAQVSYNSGKLTVEGNELIKYTQYNLTLDQALARQMSLSTPPQTDKYRNQPAYVHSQVLSGLPGKARLPMTGLDTHQPLAGG